jgi:hypothetical protein
MVEITDEMVEVGAEIAWNAVYTGPIAQWSCSGIDEAGPSTHERDEMRRQVRAALTAVAPLIAAQEREACVEIIIDMAKTHWNLDSGELAAAIRARGETP